MYDYVEIAGFLSQPAVEKLKLRSCARCPKKKVVDAQKLKMFTLNLHFFFAGLRPALKKSSMLDAL